MDCGVLWCFIIGHAGAGNAQTCCACPAFPGACPHGGIASHLCLWGSATHDLWGMITDLTGLRGGGRESWRLSWKQQRPSTGPQSTLDHFTFISFLLPSEWTKGRSDHLLSEVLLSFIFLCFISNTEEERELEEGIKCAPWSQISKCPHDCHSWGWPVSRWSVWVLSHIQLFAIPWTVLVVSRGDPVCIKRLGLRVCEGRICGPVCGRRWWGNECDWVVSPVHRPELLSEPAKVCRRSPEAPWSHSPADWGHEHRWPCGTERSLLRMDCESSL